MNGNAPCVAGLVACRRALTPFREPGGVGSNLQGASWSAPGS